MQRSDRGACCTLAVGLFGGGQGALVGRRDDALEQGVEALQPGQGEPGQLHRRHLAGGEEVCQLRDPCEGEILVVSGAGRVESRRHHLGVAPREVLVPHSRRGEPDRRGDGVVKLDCTQRPELADELVDVLDHELPIGLVELEAGDPLGLADHLGGDRVLAGRGGESAGEDRRAGGGECSALDELAAGQSRGVRHRFLHRGGFPSGETITPGSMRNTTETQRGLGPHPSVARRER